MVDRNGISPLQKNFIYIHIVIKKTFRKQKERQKKKLITCNNGHTQCGLNNVALWPRKRTTTNAVILAEMKKKVRRNANQ